MRSAPAVASISVARARLSRRAITCGALVAAALLLSDCAKGRLRLTPEEKQFIDVPESESGVVEDEDEMDETIPALQSVALRGPCRTDYAPF
jgi:hypothetical protein